MKKIKFFLIAVVLSAILSAGFIWLKLGALSIILFAIAPIFILADISEDNGETSTVCNILALALCYAVMFSPYGWLSMGLAVVLITCLIKTPLKNFSFIAAFLVGFEMAAIGMEAYVDGVYHMDNLWHDIAAAIFAAYTLITDATRKEVTH